MPNQNSQFPKEETPGLQDTARKLEEDLKRLTTHFQLLKLDKTALEADFKRYKRATRGLIYNIRGVGHRAKWADIIPDDKQYLEDIGFKPSDFD